MRLLTSLVLLLFLALQPSAQQVIRSSTDIVPVDVLVTGKDGRPIKNLTVGSFTLTEDGKERPIKLFSADRRPFTVAVIHDSTWSMELMAGQSRALRFLESLVDALDADDQITLGSLSKRLVPPTSDKSVVRRALRETLTLRSDTVATGSSDLEVPTERGLDWAINTLREIEGRKVIVILTDGRSPDNNSPGLRFDQFGYRDAAQTSQALVEQASRVNASIQVIAFDDTLVKEEFLVAVVAAGGSATLVTRDADLASACRSFVDDLHTEYLLGFEPSQFDGKQHKIALKVNLSGAKIRARNMYFAAKR